MTIAAWLDAAIRDADARGLSGLRPGLKALALAAETLRKAAWNDDASGTSDGPPPATRHHGV